MGLMELPPDSDPKMVVQSGTREPQHIEVQNAPVRLGHSPSTAKTDGRVLRSGDRAELGNFQGQPVYAARADMVADNDDVARLLVDDDSFSINLFPRTTVRGSNGTLRTTTSGTVETDNYTQGGAFDFNGSAYPYTVDPDPAIQELVITASGDVVAEITTTEGVTFSLPLAGGSGAFDKWETESVTFKDPKGTGERIAGGWAGE